MVAVATGSASTLGRGVIVYQFFHLKRRDRSRTLADPSKKRISWRKESGRREVRWGRMNSDAYSSTKLYSIRDPTGRARRLIAPEVVDSNSMRAISVSCRR